MPIMPDNRGGILVRIISTQRRFEVAPRNYDWMAQQQFGDEMALRLLRVTI